MKTKRWIAALLCFLLIGSLFPVSALAEGEPDPVYYITVTPGDGSGEAFTVNSVDNKGNSLLFYDREKGSFVRSYTTADGIYMAYLVPDCHFTAPEGYIFDCWKVEGADKTVKDGASFNVTQYAASPDYSLTLTAQWKHDPDYTYTITAIADHDGGAVITGAGEYPYGATVTLSVTPNSGYAFVQWTEDGKPAGGYLDSLKKTYTFNVTSERTFTAELIDYKNEIISATVKPNGGGGEEYTVDSKTVLSNSEYLNGNYDKNKGCFVTLKDFSLYFVLPKDAFTPPEGKEFYGWEVIGYDGLKSDDTLLAYGNYFMNSTRSATIQAIWRDLPKYTVTTSTNIEEGGTVSGSGEYTKGDSVTVTATPRKGYIFMAWADEHANLVSTDASYTFAASKNISLRAAFKPIQTVTVMPGEGGGVAFNLQSISLLSKNEINQGLYDRMKGVFYRKGSYIAYRLPDICPFTAPVGKEFDCWKYYDNFYHEDKFVNLGDSVDQSEFANNMLTITAQWRDKAPEYLITVSGDAGGTAHADKPSAAKDETVTLTATPNAGYHFKEWQSSDVTVSNNTFTMPAKNVTVKAIFEADAPTTYNIWVDGDTQVTSANKDDVLGDGTVSFDPATNTLTLSGYDGSRIKANMTLNIVLADGTENTVSILEDLCGIYTYGNCTLSGKGNLDIHSTGDGIYASNGNLTVNISGDLSVSSDSSGLSSDGYITISGSGNVVIDSKKYGLWPDKDVTISDSSKLTVTAAQYAVYIDDSRYALLLNGTGTPISLTAGEGYKAVLNDAGESPVGGTKLANYDVTGAPDTDSVVYTLGIPVTYTVSFNMGGHGDQIRAQTVEEGENAVKPTTDPSAEGWTFDGWYADATFSAAFDFNTAITADTTIYAKWKPDAPAAYTIVGYKNEGPDGAIAEVRINGEKVSEKTGTGGTLKIASDAKDVTVEVTFNRGYTFGKWFDSIVLRWGGVQSGSTNIANSRFSGKIDMPGSDWFETKDQELYLIIQTQELPMYDVNVQTNGYGLASANPKPALSGEEVVLTAMPDEGYRFKEWQSEDVVVTDNKFTMPAKAVTVTAVFEAVPSYTITFEMNGHGKQIPAQTVESGSKATKPTDPTASGWTFDGWYADATFSVEFDFNTAITTDTTVYAKWTQNTTPPTTTYTVSFNMNGHGNQVAAQTVKEGEQASKPANPTASGWTFDGWYEDATFSTAFDFNTAINADTTVYAKWTQNTTPPTTTYTVSFNMNGHGDQVAAQTVKEGAKATKPADPTASGYTFGGWYTDATCSTKFDFNSAITADTTIYAKWTKNSVKPTDPNTPKTGDNSNMLLWVVLLAASGAALTGTAIYTRKRKHN